MLELAGYTLHRANSTNNRGIFKWDDARSEEKHRHEYKSFIEHLLQDVLQERGLCVLDVAKRGSFVQAKIPGTPLLLRGRPDLLIVKDSYLFDKNDLSGVVLSIEVKKLGVRESVYQSVSQLIALQVLQPDRCSVVLHTDLQHTWEFFFFVGERAICSIVETSPASGFNAIRWVLKAEQ